MASFDAEIKVLLNAQQAYKEIAKIEKRIAGIQDTRTQTQARQLIDSQKKQVKQADAALQKQIALTSATELYARRLQQLDRAGANRTKRTSEQVAAVKRVVDAQKNNVNVLNRANTLLGRILERTREINRGQLADDAITRRVRAYSKELDLLKEIGFTEGQLRKANEKNQKLAEQSSRREFDLAKRTEASLKQQLKLLKAQVTEYDRLGRQARSISSPIGGRVDQPGSPASIRANAARSPVRGGAGFPGSPEYLRLQQAEAKKTEAALGRVAKAAVRSPIRGGINFPGSPNYLKEQARLAKKAKANFERLNNEIISNAVSSPVRGGKNFPGSPAYLEEQARAAKKATTEIEKLNNEIISNAVSSPIRGGKNFPGSPAYLEEQARAAKKATTEVEKLNNEIKQNAVSSPIRGGANFPGSPAFKELEEKDRRNRRRRGFGRAERILTGVGFPLLFGGGPGAVIGGGLGGVADALAGTTFGFSIFIGAIGQVVDQVVAAGAELGQALNPLTADVDRVAEAAGVAGTETGLFISELEELAGTFTALDAATKLLANQIGNEGVDDLKDFGDQATRLGNNIAVVFSTIAASLSDKLLPVIDAINSALENARLDEVGNRLVREGGEEGQRVREAGKGGGLAGLERQRKEVKKILQERERAIRDSSSAELTLKARVDASLKAYKLQNEVLKNRLEFQIEYNKLTDEENRKAEEESRRALQSQREMLSMFQAELDLRKQIQDVVLAANEVRIGIARLTEGEQATIALERQQASMELFAREQQIRQQLALDLQEEGANETLLTQLAERQIELLQVEKQLLDEKLKKREKEYLIGLALYKLQTRQNAADQTQRLSRSIEDQQTQLSSFGDDDALARNALLIEQSRRLEDELEKLYRTEQKLKADFQKESDPGKKNLIQERIASLQAQRTELEQTLPVLNELEMQNLKLQQSYAKIKPVVDEVVRGLFDGVQALVAGTKTAEEAFADFLNSIAQLLLKTAAEMIATYIAIGIARQFAGMSGGDSIEDLQSGTAKNPVQSAANLYKKKEVGGRTLANMPYVVGEKGAELFVPGKTGTIVPADVFEATRQAIAGNGPEGGDSDAFAQNSVALGSSASITKENTLVREMGMRANEPVDVRYESTVINSVEYVTADQFQKGIKESVNQSRASVYKDLRNKPAVRAGVGV